MSTLLIPFAFNNIGDKSGVTEKRIDLAITTAKRQYSGDLFCVFSAGYSKNSPTEPSKNNQVFLAAQMKDFVERKYGSYGINVFATARGWGTLSEMVWAIRFARFHFQLCEGTKIIVASSKDHLPRVRKYFWWILPQGWEVEYHAIDHYLNEPWKEQLKFWKDFPKLVGYSLKTAFGFKL